jgi:hypothetical protein
MGAYKAVRMPFTGTKGLLVESFFGLFRSVTMRNSASDDSDMKEVPLTPEEQLAIDHQVRRDQITSLAKKLGKMLRLYMVGL